MACQTKGPCAAVRAILPFLFAALLVGGCGSRPGRPDLPPPEYEPPAAPTPTAAPSASAPGSASVPFADANAAVRITRRQVDEDP
jgi:hypothetical protein